MKYNSTVWGRGPRSTTITVMFVPVSKVWYCVIAVIDSMQGLTHPNGQEGEEEWSWLGRGPERVVSESLSVRVCSGQSERSVLTVNDLDVQGHEDAEANDVLLSGHGPPSSRFAPPHKPPPTRKDYSKQLSQLLEASNASLSSFTAYASASPPPASNVILSVAGSLAAADEALRRYAVGVDEWRETMRMLKDMEDDVGNIMRDREILVTRLIKASKSSQKSNSGSNFRDSLLLGNGHGNRFPSSSSLSLSIAQHESRSPPLLPSELQACEAHLAAKERELEVKRSVAVRDGLGARARAMIDCGWAWGEIGQETLRALESLGNGGSNHLGSCYQLLII
ncbi:hypothetical protein B0H34DRAFT_820924 [Crassisporium funariophilum]|nr:hypothetical protein B0H34DRAFT_820924 [Crassisporium funariophilum]